MELESWLVRAQKLLLLSIDEAWSPPSPSEEAEEADNLVFSAEGVARPNPDSRGASRPGSSSRVPSSCETVARSSSSCCLRTRYFCVRPIRSASRSRSRSIPFRSLSAPISLAPVWAIGDALAWASDAELGVPSSFSDVAPSLLAFASGKPSACHANGFCRSRGIATTSDRIRDVAHPLLLDLRLSIAQALPGDDALDGALFREILILGDLLLESFGLPGERPRFRQRSIFRVLSWAVHVSRVARVLDFHGFAIPLRRQGLKQLLRQVATLLGRRRSTSEGIALQLILLVGKVEHLRILGAAKELVLLLEIGDPAQKLFPVLGGEVEQALVLFHGPLLILARLVLDALRSRGEPESAERLRVVVRRGGSRGDEHRLRVPAQRILQHAGQLGIAIRHVRLSIAKRLDDVAQGTQAAIDHLRLLQRLSRRLRLAQEFTTC
eukprot:scaffold1960_cov242-Pinguiococcus_pyrenoidosus.AAC.10